MGKLALVWGAAFALRLLYIFQSQRSPFYDFPLVDAKTYTQAAAAMALGHFGDQPFWQPPLYPHFLAVLYALFEPSFTLPRLVQAALGATLCLLIFRLGRVFSPAVGYLAAGLAACYGPFIFFEAELLPPALALVLNLLALWALLWATEGRPRRLLLPGFLFGLSALCVANVLAFVPVAALWLVWVRRGRLVGVAALLLGTALAIAPVTLRNYYVGGDWVLISYNAGLNFYIGNNAQYDETVAIQPGPAWLELTARPRVEAGVIQPSAQSDFFFVEAWDFISQQPFAYLKLLLYKLYLFWHGDEIGRNQDLYFARQYAPLLQVLLWKYGVAFPFGLLAPLALVGLGLSCRNGLLRRPEPLLLALFAGAYMLTVVAFFISARYRLPVVPILLIFAAYGGRELYLLWRRGAHRDLLVGCGAAFLLAVACNFRMGAMNVEGDAHTHYRLGYVYEKKGLPINAVAAYEQALTLDPDIKWARFNLASLYARSGEYNRAIAAYGELIRRFPEVARARLALGNVYLRTGRYAEAIAAYESLLSAKDADAADLYGRLGYAHAQLGQLDQAASAYEELVAAKPDSLQARLQLGELYEQLERLDEARAEYRQILAADSLHAAARYRLAHLLFFADQAEEAKAHLQQVIARNSDAVDARLLLATQYVVEHRAVAAMEQVQAILAVQPEHYQGNRLAGHLYMVLGDTLKGVKHLEQFTEYYREGRSAEIFEQLREQWEEQLRGSGR
ncbi:MAG: tetratricopeptide repeat protein [Gemmatimonadota bacterium]|nr:tetratricopeptide repeat protein [Gemmatimonadota bacterium]